ncbi:hypothetical protein CEXT_374331 [Caerostris extrusa]|uniref:Uncharacterized protein n=1 Tax=Caerostris extrusa TaxID=172846 RepID=A0AAV4WAF3_CAEEX|nr:hypothetical protein CEXT_374331 [Caerostris extrusa]
MFSDMLSSCFTGFEMCGALRGTGSSVNGFSAVYILRIDMPLEMEMGLSTKCSIVIYSPLHCEQKIVEQSFYWHIRKKQFLNLGNFEWVAMKMLRKIIYTALKLYQKIGHFSFPHHHSSLLQCFLSPLISKQLVLLPLCLRIS